MSSSESPSESMQSLAGFPMRLSGTKRYDGAVIAMEDGDLKLNEERSALGLVHGPQALGQAVAIGFGQSFLDLSHTEDEYRALRRSMDLGGTPRPTVDYRSKDFLMQSVEQVKWDAYHELDPAENPWFEPDMTGKSITERILGVFEEHAEYVDTIHDVRFNGHDVEIDFAPVGYDTHVLRVNDLIPRDRGASTHLKWKACMPVRRDDLIQVTELSTRLLRMLESYPELLKEIHWRTFEEVVAELFAGQGWDVQLTRSSKDGGVDVFASRRHSAGSTLVVVDAKQYTNKIGVGWVRAVAGLKLQHNADLGMLVTTSRFTRGARDLEQNELRQHVSLKDFEDLQQWLKQHDWVRDGNGLFAPKLRFSGT
jgi:hypothetical protein